MGLAKFYRRFQAIRDRLVHAPDCITLSCKFWKSHLYYMIENAVWVQKGRRGHLKKRVKRHKMTVSGEHSNIDEGGVMRRERIFVASGR